MRFKTKFLNKTRKPKYGQVIPHVAISMLKTARKKNQKKSEGNMAG